MECAVTVERQIGSDALHPAVPAARCPRESAVTVLMEPTPTGLARVFALIGALGLLPGAACAVMAGTDTLRVDLVFDGVPGPVFDRLERKLAQLTECLEVRCERAVPIVPLGSPARTA